MTLYEFLKAALEDFRKVEKSPKFSVDLNSWATFKKDGTCTVCLGGWWLHNKSKTIFGALKGLAIKEADWGAELEVNRYVISNAISEGVMTAYEANLMDVLDAFRLGVSNEVIEEWNGAIDYSDSKDLLAPYPETAIPKDYDVPKYDGPDGKWWNSMETYLEEFKGNVPSCLK